MGDPVRLHPKGDQPDLASLVGQACMEADTATAQHARNARLALYDALGTCAIICRVCSFDADKYDELRRLIAAQPRGDQNRRYVERQSDVYTRVCRYVFINTNHTNVCRYAHTLREAEKAQIRPLDLSSWLNDNGGVNALYYRRPLHEAEVATKVLRLTRKIVFSRTDDFTITLRWTPENTFEPLFVGDADQADDASPSLRSKDGAG